MKAIYWNFLLVYTFCLFACNNNPKSPCPDDMETGFVQNRPYNLTDHLAKKGIPILAENYDVPREFGYHMDTFFNRYLEMEEALVKADTAKANAAANVMLFLLSLVDKPMKEKVTAKAWETYSAGYEKNLRAFIGAKSLQEKRLYFSYISEYLYSTFKSFHMKKEDIHLVYCPMAFNEKGAYWLSANHKIRNPYFGDERLKCGQITEVLPE
ncbi:MAG TPA: DUF3347 domain-containing protein [Bacteroidetes bacterium]|nr:DUF3347 domain-containing protein [Bacteroidota bacterium]